MNNKGERRVQSFKDSELAKKILIFFAYLGSIYIAFNQFIHYRVTSDFVPGYAIDRKYYIDFNWVAIFKMGPSIFFSQVVNRIFEILGNDNLLNTSLPQYFNMMLYALSATILYMAFVKLIQIEKNKNLLFIPILVIFINPFIVEHYVYHSITQSLGTLMVAICIFCFSKKKYALMILSGFLAQNFYQTNIFIILILSVAYSYLQMEKKDMSIQVLCKEVWGIILSALGPVIYFVYYTGMIIAEKRQAQTFGGQVVSNAKDPTNTASIETVLNRMMKGGKALYTDAFEFLPENMVPVLVLGVLVVVFLLLMVYEKKISSLVLWVLTWGIITILPVLFWFVTDYGYYARIGMPLFYSISMLLCILVVKAGKYENYFLKEGVVAGIMIFFMALFFHTQSCVTDSFKGQALDEFVVKAVEVKIAEYQEESGNQVTEIAVTGKPGRTWKYQQQFDMKYDYNHKIFYDTWAQVDYLNLICGRNYKSVIMTEEEYDYYFGDISAAEWDLSEQLKFDGSRAYWFIY